MSSKISHRLFVVGNLLSSHSERSCTRSPSCVLSHKITFLYGGGGGLESEGGAWRVGWGLGGWEGLKSGGRGGAGE